ncbi:MAG: hypothetical protein NTU72_08155 [Fimbriimonadales bacterium]|nr:hypothetical protein [Fimbriimonadales bacterium]
MNIFFLHKDPRIAAQYHCDKHVVKMILESAQLLYCAHWMTDPSNIPHDAYKLTHKNHPCSLWVRESYENYMWLAALAWWLCKEYQHRYGSQKTHKTQAHIEWLLAHPPAIEHAGITTFRQAMPDEYKRPESLDAYRTYYIHAKARMLAYTNRDFPEFLLTKTN